MKRLQGVPFMVWSAFLAAALLWSSPARAGDYDFALKGVKQMQVVFDVSHGDAKTANILFWAVRNTYSNETVKKLPRPARVAVVFHGPAVALLSTNRQGLEPAEAKERDAFVTTLREMKKEGVRLEVCMYAVNVMGVSPGTLIPEVNQVANGFVSVAGYQRQGYAVVTLP